MPSEVPTHPVRLNHEIFEGGQPAYRRGWVRATAAVVLVSLAGWGAWSYGPKLLESPEKAYQRAYDDGRFGEALPLAEQLLAKNSDSAAAQERFADVAERVAASVAAGPERKKLAEQGLDAARRAQKLDSGSAAPLWLAGRAYELLADDASAEGEYRDALAAYPGDVPATLAYARMLVRQGKATGALGYLGKIAKQNKENEAVALEIGRALLAAGRDDLADSTARALFGSVAKGVASAARLVSGAAALNNKEYDEALNLAREAAAIAPSGDAYVLAGEATLAQAFAGNGQTLAADLAKVRDLAAKGVAAAPNQAKPYVLAARAAALAGDAAAAKDFAQRAVVLLGGDLTLSVSDRARIRGQLSTATPE